MICKPGHQTECSALDDLQESHHPSKLAVFRPDIKPQLALCLKALGKAFDELLADNPGLAVLVAEYAHDLFNQGAKWVACTAQLLQDRRVTILERIGYPGAGKSTVKLLRKLSPDVCYGWVHWLTKLEVEGGLPSMLRHASGPISTQAADIAIMFPRMLYPAFLDDLSNLRPHERYDVRHWFLHQGGAFSRIHPHNRFRSIADWERKIAKFNRDLISDLGSCLLPMPPVTGTSDGYVKAVRTASELADIAHEFENCLVDAYGWKVATGDISFYRLSDDLFGEKGLISVYTFQGLARPGLTGGIGNMPISENAKAFLDDWVQTRNSLGNSAVISADTWLRPKRAAMLNKVLGKDFLSTLSPARFMAEGMDLLGKAGLIHGAHPVEEHLLNGDFVVLGEPTLPGQAVAMLVYLDGGWRLARLKSGTALNTALELLDALDAAGADRESGAGQHGNELFYGVDFGPASDFGELALEYELLYSCDPPVEKKLEGSNQGTIRIPDFDTFVREARQAYLPIKPFLNTLLGGNGLGVTVSTTQETAHFITIFTVDGDVRIPAAVSTGRVMGAPPKAYMWRAVVDNLDWLCSNTNIRHQRTFDYSRTCSRTTW